MAKPEKPDECDACAFPTKALEFYHNAVATRQDSWLCFLCASTMSGNAYHHPNVYAEHAAVLGTICYVGNAVIAEVRRAIKEVRR